jgi:glycosyltransferase involved in cell wall biosynthesis
LSKSKPEFARDRRNSATDRRPRAARILIVTPQPFYEDRGTPIAVRYVARALSELGVETEILAFPVGEDVQLPHIRIRRCGNPLRLRSVPIGFSWRKVVMDLSLAHSFEHLLATRRYDMVHAVEDAAYIAALLCPAYGQPFIYDMASAIPVELQRTALFRNALARRLAEAAQRRVFERASHVVCSAGLAQYVHARSPDVPVSEWSFPAQTEPADAEQVAALKRNLHIPSWHRVLLYCGNFASYQGVDLLVNAFRLARRRNPQLSLVCVGATEPEIRDWKSRFDSRGLERVHLVERQRRDRIPAYLGMADCLVSPRIAGNNLPLKLFDYMATGKPIIATRGNAHQPLLDEGRAMLSDPTPEGLAETIVRTFESPSEARAVGSRARRYAVQNLNWEGFVRFVSGIYRDALGDPLGGHRFSPAALQ